MIDRLAKEIGRLSRFVLSSGSFGFFGESTVEAKGGC